MILNFYTVTSLTNFLFCGSLAVFLILKGKKDHKKVSFFIFSGCVAIWNLFYMFWQNSMNDHDTALFFARALMVPVTLIPAAYTHFAAAVTETIEKEKKVLIAFYTISIAFFISSLTPYFITEVMPIMEFNYWPKANYINTAYWTCFFIFVVYASSIIIRGYVNAKGVKKLQLKYVGIGLIISFTTGTFDIWPWYGLNIPPWPHGLAPIYILMMWYSITRFRLLDIRIIAKNIFFYLMFAVLLYGIFYFIAFLYEIFFGGIFKAGAYILGLFIAPVIAILMYGGSEYLSKIVNRYLFPSAYEYQKAMTKVSQELGNYTDLNKIVSIIITTIDKIIKPQNIIIFLVRNDDGAQKLEAIASSNANKISVALDYNLFLYFLKKESNAVIREELDQMIEEKKSEKSDELNKLLALKDQMERYGIYIFLLLKNGEEFSGVISLEEKRDSDSYTQEDIKLLEILSYQAGVAINNAALYKKIEEKNAYLQELLDTKNDFIRIASHQLNTPLSIMRLAYHMVDKKTITMKEAMKYWHTGIDRMDRTIQDFWRVLESEGGVKTNPQPADILPGIRETVAERAGINSKANKNLQILFEENINMQTAPKVFCDQSQISYVFSNLLDNAIHYTKEGSIVVSYEITKDKKYLKVSVKDTGIGFSKEDAEKIGKKFYRTKEGTLTSPDGSGLGVYICKKFVEGNKGIFSFESAGKGKGSTFSFALPIYKENPSA